MLTFLIAGEVIFADVLLLPNGMSKVTRVLARDPGFSWLDIWNSC